MTRPIFQLGSFQFDLPNGVPQTLDRQAEFRWEEQGRLFREPAVQFLGPGSQTINLSGVLFPGFTGRQSTLDQLRDLAGRGQPEMMTDGLGRIYGKWGIRRVREQQETFAPGGGARQIGFDLELVKYAEDNPGQAASPLSVQPGSGLAGTLSQSIGDLAFNSSGSAFDAASWALNPTFSVPALAAQGAGFNLGQLATIARSVGNGDYVAAALGAFGLAGLTVDQSNAWAQLGIHGAGLVQAMTSRRGAPAMSIGLGALGGAPALLLEQLAGEEAAGGLGNLVRDAATVATLLDVDPKVTEAVRSLVTL